MGEPNMHGTRWGLGRTVAGLAASAIALSSGLGGAAAQSNLPGREEMWQIIQRQQREIETLKRGQTNLEQGQEQTKKAVEATADAVKAAETRTADGGAGGWWDRTSIGGYGELHYNGGNANEIDFHRFVLFFGHEFNERIRLVTELELEHALAGDGAPGEVELEQAYIEMDFLEKRLSTQAGVFLIPVGFLNETHEPPTFYGVERNPIETNIIPTTWWEGGLNTIARFGGGFSVNAAVHSGLDVPDTGANAFRVRNGRQKVAQARFTDPAVTGRVKWTGVPGLELAATGQYQFDVTQTEDVDDVGATLFSAHAAYRHRGFGLRALYARWDLDGPGPDAIGRDVQYGWYVEPSYRFPISEFVGDLGFFVRYAEWDNSAGDDASPTGEAEWSFGFNWWPHPQVVFKLDYQIQDFEDDTGEDDRINLGVGYQF